MDSSRILLYFTIFLGGFVSGLMLHRLTIFRWTTANLFALANLLVLGVLVIITAVYAKAARDTVRAMVKPFLKVSATVEGPQYLDGFSLKVENVGVATALSPSVTIQGEGVNGEWNDVSLGVGKSDFIEVNAPSCKPEDVPETVRASLKYKDLFKEEITDTQQVDMSSYRNNVL